MKADKGSNAGREKLWHRLFEIGIWIKGIDGLIETICGIVLLTVSFHALNSYIVTVTQDEIQQDSGDLIARVLSHAAHHLTNRSKLIAGAYLLGNGLVKVFLAVCILRGKLWCYPVAIIVMSVFILLQIARMGFHFSWSMLLATIVSATIVALIWREYSRIHKR